MNLQIRKATLDDLDRLMEIFEEARRFMLSLIHISEPTRP